MTFGVNFNSASTSTSQMGVVSAENPHQKYSKGKLNPDWTKWIEDQKRAQGFTNVAATSVPNPAIAPPVVCSMQDLIGINETVPNELAMTVAVEQAQNRMQTSNYAQAVCLNQGDTVDELGKVMAKHEMPMGVMPLLLDVSNYHAVEFIIDDSGSMTYKSDTQDKFGRTRTRKEEALSRVLEMVEVLCYINTPVMKFRFLNYKDRQCCLSLKREGRSPDQFFRHCTDEVEKLWRKPDWKYRTPMRETIYESFHDRDNVGKRVIRYIFGDGVPDGGKADERAIKAMFDSRSNPQDNPFNFMACTGNDEDVEWMSELEETTPYCSATDDSNDEIHGKDGIRANQGDGFPVTTGLCLAAALVGPMNPVLDCMDESVPYTKYCFDQLQGYVSTDEMYRSYYDGFLVAQQKRSYKNGQSRADRVKNSMNWNNMYTEFYRLQNADQIPAVGDYRKRLKDASR